MSDDERILAGVLERAESPDLLETLTERLRPQDLQSLMLEVYRRRASRLTPRDLAEQWATNRFVRPSDLRPEALLEFDRFAFSILPEGFEPIELSPVAPLGTNSAIATVDQHKVLSTARNTEVTADSTNVMALECARRRRELTRKGRDPHRRVKLCASHRVVRAQVFAGAHLTAHFRLLGLCTAGRDGGSYRFETSALAEQIGFFLRLFADSRDLGYRVDAVQVGLTDLSEGRMADALGREVLEPLRARFAHADLAFAPERERGRGYYTGACFEIRIRNAETETSICDGGFTDWTRALLSDRKERLLIAGLGTEQYVRSFRG